MLSVLEIGERIAIARKLKNLSQAQLAELLCVSAQAVGKWERGESMPDIITFGRLGETLGVDLNYFGGGQGTPGDTPGSINTAGAECTAGNGPRWNMSGSSWVDVDFSGLRGLAERFSGANIEKCLFIGSELCGLTLKNNNIQRSDFTRSDLRRCNISSANLENNIFADCDFTKSEFTRSNINDCDFSGANLTNVTVKWSSIQRVKLSGATLLGAVFRMTHLNQIIIDSEVANCAFENCDFTRVEFNGATIRNTFFKNTKLKRAKFISCKADKLSYAFMKSSKADLTGVQIIEES